MAMTTALVTKPIGANVPETQPPAVPRTGQVRLDQGWSFRKGPLLGVWQVWREEENSEWHPVVLPHCVNALDSCDPDNGYFRGQSWYRTQIPTHNELQGSRTLLHFQGAGQTTTVWVESTLIGTHKGGYDEFVFDLTDALNGPQKANGERRIAVLCDNAPDVDRVPSDLSDFCLYGGLYRHVNLVHVPQISIHMVHVASSVGKDGAGRLRVSSRLYNPNSFATRCVVEVHVFDPAGRTIRSLTRNMETWSGVEVLAEFDLPNPKLWSPQAPTLYRCEIQLHTSAGSDSSSERFGFRTVEFTENGPFKLNGQRLLLRGTHRHADHAGMAAAMPDDLVRTELTLIRDMGANFIRLAHYQQDRLVLDLCDELGLIVWEEVPWCRAGVGSDSFRQNAKEMLTHMIDQHYNHPSVVFWGLGNEDDWPDEYPEKNQNEIRQLMMELRDLAHRLDPDRLTAVRRCDFARDIPDVYSPSIWAGWYRGTFEEYEASLQTERKRVKRLIHVEWGADSQAGRHAEQPEAIAEMVSKGTGSDERALESLRTGGLARVSRDGDWSESYACDLFDWHLKTQETLGWLSGSAQWAFKDFASPLRGDNDIPHINQKGVVERDLTRKESYYVFQSYWAEEPMVHIYGHTWPVRWGRPGQTRTVKIYSNCPKVELFVNGRSAGVRERNSQNFPAAGLRWNAVFVEGENHLRAEAIAGLGRLSDEVGFTYQTQRWGKPAGLRISEIHRANDVVSVRATLHDPQGVACLDARNLIRFSVAGDGDLIDNLGTARASRSLQMYNGRSDISVKVRGKCTIAVSSGGLPAALLSL